MEKHRNDIDELIKEALGQEEATYYKQLEEEQSVLQEGLELFKGRRAWILIGVGIVMIAFIVFGIYCLNEFFKTENVKELMIWGGGFFMAIIATAALKLYGWMQMDKNSLMREIKRLEFQVNVLIKEVHKN